MHPTIFSLLMGTACAPKPAELDTLTAEPVATPAPTPVASMVDPKGGYPTVPLEKDTVTLAVIQNNVTPMTTPETAQATISENLAHISEMIQKACAAEKKPDILLLHEFPLTGYLPGDRDAKLQMTIEIRQGNRRPRRTGQRSDAYLVFGAYARDAE